MEKRKRFHVIYTDFSIAFDSVNYTVLLNKLNDLSMYGDPYCRGLVLS